MPTKQETFDIVVNHLRQQGRKSTSGEADGCAYRGDGGLMCAAGVLIPDAMYESQFEGWAIGAGDCGGATSVIKKLEYDIALVASLQDAHDTADEFEFLASIEEKFLEIAEDFGLTYTPPAASTP